MNEVTIIGGGLAGLSCALQLNKFGIDVTVIERKKYPIPRVCGEYISNEVLPYLRSLELDIDSLEPSSLTDLVVTGPNGKAFSQKLDLGGFGLSRTTFEMHLYKAATARGVRFMLGQKVNDILFQDDHFILKLDNDEQLLSKIAVAAHGKRSNIDQKLNRPFFHQRSPYLGVKYHIQLDFPEHIIQLDNFQGGYCGLCKIEGDQYSFCYLTENRHLKTYGSIQAMEEAVLLKNPVLKQHFKHARFLSAKPEVINEISFERKTLVENHLLFCGDAAGMITPLCGNGMAMALHSGKLLADAIVASRNSHGYIRAQLEEQYVNNWNRHFKARLLRGRIIQKCFGNSVLSNLAIGLLKTSSTLSNLVIKSTHGEVF